MTVTYRTGYGTTRRTLSELMAWSKFAGLHPEIQRRIIALMDAARRVGVDLGVGGAFRSYEEQKRLFLSRHNLVASGGCCGFEGKRYALISGSAHAAPPYRSYHEGTVSVNGVLKGVALDMVGWENGWMEKNIAPYGMRSFAGLTGGMYEPWHLQPANFPTSRSSYNPSLHTLTAITLPPAPAPAPSGIVAFPDPTIRLGSTGTEVKELQQHCKFWGWYTATVDGSCGPVTVDAIKKMQAMLKLTQDGVYGSVTAGAYKKFLTALSNL